MVAKDYSKWVQNRTTVGNTADRPSPAKLQAARNTAASLQKKLGTTRPTPALMKKLSRKDQTRYHDARTIILKEQTWQKKKKKGQV